MAVTCRPDTFGSRAALGHADVGEGDPDEGDEADGRTTVGVRPVGDVACDVAPELGWAPNVD